MKKILFFALAVILSVSSGYTAGIEEPNVTEYSSYNYNWSATGLKRALELLYSTDKVFATTLYNKMMALEPNLLDKKRPLDLCRAYVQAFNAVNVVKDEQKNFELYNCDDFISMVIATHNAVVRELEFNKYILWSMPAIKRAISELYTENLAEDLIWDIEKYLAEFENKSTLTALGAKYEESLGLAYELAYEESLKLGLEYHQEKPIPWQDFLDQIITAHNDIIAENTNILNTYNTINIMDSSEKHIKVTWHPDALSETCNEIERLPIGKIILSSCKDFFARGNRLSVNEVEQRCKTVFCTKAVEGKFKGSCKKDFCPFFIQELYSEQANVRIRAERDLNNEKRYMRGLSK